MDKESETFIVHIVALKALLAEIYIHHLKKAQIITLNQKKAPTKVLVKYSDFLDVFSPKKALMLLEKTELNEHAIELENGKQPSYKLTYSLGPVELETSKTYIKTHLKTKVIWLFKSPAGALILFDKKPNGNFCLCINYQGLNNLTIKN